MLGYLPTGGEPGRAGVNWLGGAVLRAPTATSEPVSYSVKGPL